MFALIIQELMLFLNLNLSYFDVWLRLKYIANRYWVNNLSIKFLIAIKNANNNWMQSLFSKSFFPNKLNYDSKNSIVLKWILLNKLYSNKALNS